MVATGSGRTSGRDGMVIPMVTNSVGKNHTNRLTWEYFPRILTTWEIIPQTTNAIHTSPRSLSCETNTSAPLRHSSPSLLSRSDPAQPWPRTADPVPEAGRAAVTAAVRHPRAAHLHPVVTTAAGVGDAAATMAPTPAETTQSATRVPMTARETRAARGAPTTRPAMLAGAAARTMGRTTAESRDAGGFSRRCQPPFRHRPGARSAPGRCAGRRAPAPRNASPRIPRCRLGQAGRPPPSA